MSPSREEDGELVRRIVAGQQDAVEKLDALYRKRIYGYIRPKVRDDDFAFDIIQKALLNFLEKGATTYDPGKAGLLTFLCAIAENVRIDEIRRRRREIQHDDDEDGSIESEYMGAALGVEIMSLLRGDEMLGLIFRGTSPPHQLIAFGFVNGLDWKPREVVAELSPRTLLILEEKLEADYSAVSQLSRDTIRIRFQALRNNMTLPLVQVLTEDKTRKLYQSFLEVRTGKTSLNQYFMHDPGQDIAEWCYAVRRRVVAEIAQM